jgi:hypothetical protein
MNVRYTRNGTTPSYECVQAHKQQGGPFCQFVRGDGIDAAVAGLFLDAIQPAQLAVSLATLEEIDTQARQIERQWQLQLERARYEADLARRRFLAVEPENRLVARTLERDWNDKLAAVDQREREYAARSPELTQQLSAEERQRIVALAEDLPALWHAPTTTAAERKHLLRLLIKDVTLTKQASTIAMAVRWQTDACTTVEVPRPPRSWFPAAFPRAINLARPRRKPMLAPCLGTISKSSSMQDFQEKHHACGFPTPRACRNPREYCMLVDFPQAWINSRKTIDSPCLGILTVSPSMPSSMMFRDARRPVMRGDFPQAWSRARLRRSLRRGP